MAPPHKFLFLDFETYYSDTYSLRCMTTPAYILSPMFETILCAVKEDMQPAKIIDGPDFGAYLSTIDPATTTTVTFNALFDNSILAWVYGFVPARMLDAMGMARALRGHVLTSASLASVAKNLGIGAKGDTLIKAKGRNRASLMSDPQLWSEYQGYALSDVNLCAGIFDKLSPEFPPSERRVMDLVLRCCVQPQFLLDTPLLDQHLIEVKADKEALMASVDANRKDLMSTAKFQAALEALGVTIQYKKSLSNPEKSIPAFAKSDDFMAELQEHDNPDVQALAAARLGLKSTLEETRTEKLLGIAKLPWHNYRDGNPRLYSGGTMPIPLRYGGAHTHRLSGEWGMNMQNLPSSRAVHSVGPRAGQPLSKLRKALKAPPGWTVIVSDLAQIEARLCAWICQEQSLLAQFANKEDPYAIMGGAIFGYPVDPAVNKLERFIGKTAILGLGYGCGWKKFYDMVIKLARVLKQPLGDIWTQALAQKSVNAYRTKYANIKNAWGTLDAAIGTSWLGNGNPTKFGPCIISKGAVELPNGMFLRYDNPRSEAKNYSSPGSKAPARLRTEFFYRYGKFEHHLYGAKLLENIVQALARIVVMNAALRLSDRGYRFKLQAHDELVFLVQDADVDNAKQIIHTEMTRRPSWAPDLPLSASTEAGKSYGEAK